jgi:hypothetical protein
MRNLIVLLIGMLPLSAVAEPDADAIIERMQAAVHHGVALAAQGAGLVIEAKAGVGSIDAKLSAKGRELIEAGKAMVQDAASGESMMKLHSMNLTEDESAAMIAIHRLEGAAMTYLKMLDEL